MAFQKLFIFIQRFFGKDGPNNKFNKDMNRILSHLNDKKIILEAQLENEENDSKRNHIIITLKVISKQIEKGNKKLRERAVSPSQKRYHYNNRAELSPRI